MGHFPYGMVLANISWFLRYLFSDFSRNKMRTRRRMHGPILRFWISFIWSIWKLKQITPASCFSTAVPQQNTRQHYCHLNFPFGKYDVILDSTTLPSTFEHKVYFGKLCLWGLPVFIIYAFRNFYDNFPYILIYEGLFKLNELRSVQEGIRKYKRKWICGWNFWKEFFAFLCPTLTFSKERQFVFPSFFLFEMHFHKSS